MNNNGPTTQDPTGQEKPVIQAIAKFEQPIGHLNKLGVKVPGQFAISVRRKSPNSRVWRATWHETGRPFTSASGEDLESEMYNTLRSEIETYFGRKVVDWKEFTA